MKKSIFFVEAPFQVLSAYEAIPFFSLEDYSLVVRLSGEKANDIQLKQIVNFLFKDSKNIEFTFIKSRNRTLLDYLRMIKYLVKISVMQFQYKYVFIGNMESGFLSIIMKVINKNKIFLLDDGIKSITFQNTFTEKKYFNLFTMLNNLKPIANQIIIYNNFKHIEKLISNIKYNNNVLFVGSKLNEVGIVTEAFYIEYIKKISNYYKNNKILYIPHRGESENKLAKIAMVENIEIVKMDYPVEFYPIFFKSCPKHIASFYSAALISLSKLYPEIKVKSFFIQEPLIYKNEIKEAYRYIKNYVEVVNLDD